MSRRSRSRGAVRRPRAAFRTGAPAVVRATCCVAVLLALLVAPVVAAPAVATVGIGSTDGTDSTDSTDGIEVRYAAGADRILLTGLAPGTSRTGFATVTNGHDAPVELRVAARTDSPVPVGLTVQVELCPTSWTADTCAGGSRRVTVGAEPTVGGVLAGGQSAHVRILGALDRTAGNETQGLSVEVTVVVTATERPDVVLGSTGAAPAPLLWTALGLLVGGTVLVRRRRRTAA